MYHVQSVRRFEWQAKHERQYLLLPINTFEENARRVVAFRVQEFQRPDLNTKSPNRLFLLYTKSRTICGADSGISRPPACRHGRPHFFDPTAYLAVARTFTVQKKRVRTCAAQVGWLERVLGSSLRGYPRALCFAHYPLQHPTDDHVD